MTENEYFCNWSRVIDFNLLHKALAEIKKLNIKDLCPNYKDIFKSFMLCEYENLKVVVVGQDPYPQKGVATGLAFGNNRGGEISPSLKILLKASGSGDCTLESWASQGVLLLNSSLTTIVGKTNVHGWIWRPFMKDLLHTISTSDRGLVFILFGNEAQSFEDCIYNRGNFILKEKHPSWYARNNKDMPIDVFTETKSILKDYRNFDLTW